MKYYVIAGEASGDMHAANLMKALQRHDSNAAFRFWGGDLMQEVAGTAPVKHYKELAFMGFAEVVANLPVILRNIRFCKNDILSYNPDAVIFIDYPGFNLRIAEFAHNEGFKTIYYISPQIWAWKESRIKKIKRNIDRMLVILPFEEQFYAGHNYKAFFTGHPLLEEIEPVNDPDANPPVIALAPGSRKQEVERMLPVMLDAASAFKGYKIVIAASSHLPAQLYNDITGERDVEIQVNAMRKVISGAEAALVTSGTATLETALLGIPQVVCYKAGNISYQIAKRLVKIDYISLVNLIMEREVVKELIQNEMKADNVKKELEAVLKGGEKRERIIEDYRKIPAKLGGKGASDRGAAVITDFLKNN